MALITITTDDFKSKFDRGDFTYGDDLPAVRDKDIEDAIDNAMAIFNPEIYPIPSDEAPSDVGKKALYYLTAHELVNLLEDSNSQGQSRAIQSSRSVGGISESLQLPEWASDPLLAYFATTNYGIRYINISLPFTIGSGFIVAGATTP